MKRTLCLCLTIALAPLTAGAQEWESLFDGKTLDGWNGDPKFWSVEDGAITGRTTEDNPTRGNTFIIWEGGEVGDFELTFEYKIMNGNSGVQYRSFKLEDAADQWRIGGYQGDFEAGDRYSGILYGENFRGILADRGQKTVIGEDGKPKVVATLGASDAIQDQIKKEDWNTYHITAKDFHFIHQINGVTTAECTDEDTDTRRASGLLAFQLHAGPPMTVQVRNIKLKRLGEDAEEGEDGEDKEASAPEPRQRAAAGERRREAAGADRPGAEPSDALEQLTLRVTPRGGYILSTPALSEAGLEALLAQVAEMEKAPRIRIVGSRNLPIEAVAKATALCEEANLESEIMSGRRQARTRNQNSN